MNAVARFLMRNVKNVTNKSRVKVPWLIVAIMRQCNKPHKMDPVFRSASSMDVPIITIVTALRNFSMSAVQPVGNVKFDAVAKIYAMKVAIFLRMLIFDTSQLCLSHYFRYLMR